MIFAPGQAVRVKDDWPERDGPVHIRTPHYVRGATGAIERRLGEFPNPEDLAFSRPASTLPLYHVRFRLAAVWPEDRLAADEDSLVVEIYGHWLEAA